ncbi:MAG: TlpA family protein disulfide reductase [Candidatus Kuenenia sp.]|nr:TlpA family protein disulfide reductase [Candidatus Kuenenia hertensis]
MKMNNFKVVCRNVLYIMALFILCKSAYANAITRINFEDLNKIVSGNKGKVVLVNFWATWCPYCRKELPGFNSLQEKYNGKVEIIGIAFDENGEQVVPPFLKKWNVMYTNYLAGEDLSSEFSLLGFPTTIVYDTNGNEVNKHIGYVSEQVFENDIKKLLK